MTSYEQMAEVLSAAGLNVIDEPGKMKCLCVEGRTRREGVIFFYFNEDGSFEYFQAYGE